LFNPGWKEPVRKWALVALCVTIGGTIFAIVNIGVNAGRVQLSVSTGGFSSSSSLTVGVSRLMATQLALGAVSLLLCLAFIGLYVFIFIMAYYRMSKKQQQITDPVQRSQTKYT
jgi:hypothetical protein